MIYLFDYFYELFQLTKTTGVKKLSDTRGGSLVSWIYLYGFGSGNMFLIFLTALSLYFPLTNEAFLIFLLVVSLIELVTMHNTVILCQTERMKIDKILHRCSLETYFNVLLKIACALKKILWYHNLFITLTLFYLSK